MSKTRNTDTNEKPRETKTAAGEGEEKSLFKNKGRKAPLLIGAVVLGVLVLVLIVVGAYFIIDAITFVSTDDAAVDGQHVNISSKMLGRIKDLPVSEGDTVETGQVLVLLDDADLKAQEAQAAASLEYAKQNRVLAELNLTRAQDDFRRVQGLFSAGATTKEQYLHASQAADSARAQLSLAQAQVDTAQAQLGVIETQLLNTRITAPVPGTIAKRSFAVGDVVQPGQTIFTLNNLDNIWVTANFEETKISRIAVGAPVDINVDAFSGYPFKGTVSRVGAGILPPPFSIGEFTKTTQRIPVRIDFNTVPEGTRLLPGMSVEVRIKAK
jgi:membrane fusion protein (multidrug efflux system)